MSLSRIRICVSTSNELYQNSTAKWNQTALNIATGEMKKLAMKKNGKYSTLIFTHLLIQSEKHKVDSGRPLHSVPSMIKFHSPEKYQPKTGRK